MARANGNTSRMDDLLASVTGDLLGDLPQAFNDNTIRVERILLEMVRPDPVQPRRVLPESIHLNFHNNRVTPTQALRELVQIVQIAARQRGRPFNSVLELLPNGDDERDDEPAVNLSPEETLLRDLVNLAITIRDDGQVNPLTVVDVTSGRDAAVSHRNRRAPLLGDVAAARLHPRLHRRWHDPVHHHPDKSLIRVSSGEREHLTFRSDSGGAGTTSGTAAAHRSRV